MKHAHPIDRMIDARGRYRSTPGLVVEADTTLNHTREGSLCLHGGTYTIAAGVTNFGIIVLQPGSQLVVLGTQSGTVQVHEGASVELHGVHSGELRVLPGGKVRVEPEGRLAGPSEIRGLLQNAGTRGGTVSLHDDGELVDLPGSTTPSDQGGRLTLREDDASLVSEP